MKFFPLLLAPVLLLASCSWGGSQARDPTHGVETWLAVGAVRGTQDKAINGVVRSHRFEDGTSRAIVQVNIDQPPEGKFYEAWLIREEPAHAIDLGPLASPTGDVRHHLQWSGTDDVTGYLSLKITLESDEPKSPSADIVAEARLKEYRG